MRMRARLVPGCLLMVSAVGHQDIYSPRFLRPPTTRPAQVGTQTNTMQLWCKWYLILVIVMIIVIMARIIESNSCKDEKPDGLLTHHSVQWLLSGLHIF